MFPYLILISTPVIYLFLKILTRKQNSCIGLIVSGVYLWSFVAFRGLPVGTDTMTYSGLFYSISHMSGNLGLISNSLHIEYGYVLLNKIISLFTDNYLFVQLIVSFVTIFLLINIILKSSSDYLMSLEIFISLTYYFLLMNISRQFLAVSILSLSLLMIIREKRILGLIFIILAGLIHQSAFLFLAVWILSKFKLTKNRFYCLVGGTVILGVPLINVLNRLMVNNERYNIGILNGSSSGSGKGLFGVIYALIIFIFLIIYYLIYDFENDNSFSRNLMYILLIITFLNIANIKYPFLGRIRYVFEPFLILIIPEIIKKLKLSEYRLVIYILIEILGFIAIYKLIPNNPFYGVVPYSFWR